MINVSDNDSVTCHISQTEKDAVKKSSI